MKSRYEVPAIGCGVCDEACDGCKEAVVSALVTLDGVERIDVDGCACAVEVEGVVGDIAVRDVLADLGYDVQAVSEITCARLETGEPETTSEEVADEDPR